MSDNWQQGIRELLRQSSICFLATSGHDGPETSMAPYAVHQGSILLHLSSLAKHSANIERHPVIGIMICTPETEADSPLALPRLSIQGQVTPVMNEQIEAAKTAYLTKIPDAEPLFSFADFRLFQFNSTAINWVGGFGKARKVSPEQWTKLSDDIQHGL